MDTVSILGAVKKRLDIYDNNQDVIIECMIEDVLNVLLNKRYPFDMSKDIDSLPSRYVNWVVRATVSAYNSIGMLNVKRYAENGYQITFQDVVNGIPTAMMSEIVSKVGVTYFER